MNRKLAKLLGAKKDHPDITRPQVERIRDLMNAHVRDRLVTDGEDLIEALALGVTFGSIATGTSIM